jgi:hypothetical protein
LIGDKNPPFCNFTKFHQFATEIDFCFAPENHIFFSAATRPVSRTTGPGRVLAVVSSIEARLPGGARNLCGMKAATMVVPSAKLT